MKTAMLLACATVASSSIGCIAPIVIGGDNTTSSGTAGTSAGGTGGTGPTSNGVAMRQDQLPPEPSTVGVGGGGSVGTSGVGGGSSIDPATLVINIDSEGVTCGNPYMQTGGACHDHWHTTLLLPPAAQTVGQHGYSSDGLDVQLYTSIALDDCGGGGGSGSNDVEVLAISDTEITVKITGAVSTPGLDPNGTYTVPRCFTGSTPTVDGVALHPNQIPDPGAGSSVSVGTGGGPDASNLVVIVHDQPVTNQALTCSNPYGQDGNCSVAGWEVSVNLPLAYQQPGTYSLGDPALISTFGQWDVGCAGGGGSFLDGTMEIVSIDASSLVVHFYGTPFASTLDKDLTIGRCN